MNLILKPLIVFNLLILSSFVYSQNFWQGVPGPTGTVNNSAINSSGYIFISGGCGLLRSTDDGESWTGVQPSNFGEISITINSSDHVFVGTYGDGIYKSTDNGGSWTQINNGLTNLYVYSLATHQNDDIYAGLYLDVCKSTNNGNSWSPTNLGATFVVTMDINSGGVIFAGANLLGIYKSTDNGATWNICNNGLTTANIFTLSISSNDDIYLGTVNGGAFRSTDEGNNWLQIGLTSYEVRCFAFAPNGDVYSGTNDGVFKSTDNGGSWTHLSSSGLNNPYVHCLFFNSEGYLFAGTGISLCRSVEPVITSAENITDDNPDSFLLLQNFPNPFNPATIIKFGVPERSNVIIKIYDLLSSEVKTIINEEMDAGWYERTFNAAGLSSGVYIYRIEAAPLENQSESFIRTKKMLLIK